MILTGKGLVDTLRDKANIAKYRIWIASPFIGEIRDVKRIIGGVWECQSIDFRVISDIDTGFIKISSFKELRQFGQIKNLRSIHAKIFIIDDWCLLTSANLTGTAFSKRYEIGTTIEDPYDINQIESIFIDWWNKARIVKSIPTQKKSTLTDYQDGSHFSKKCDLPPYIAQNILNDKYLANIDLYKSFCDLYEITTGRVSNMKTDGFSLFQEVDYLFNYLYHEHPKQPSKGTIKPRNLSKQAINKEINKYYLLLADFYNSDDKNKQLWRLDRSMIIKQKLSPKYIDKLNLSDVKEIISCLHCYSSFPLNKTRFVNNNLLEDIIYHWKNLLHTGDITYDKIKQTTSALRFFGNSSISELIGWYFPDKYPLMNSNSHSGMKFFGYDVK